MELELMLERPEKREAGHTLEAVERSLQQRPRAVVPRRAIGILDVADDELFGAGILRKLDPGTGRRVGKQEQVPQRAEGTLGDSVEAGDLDIGWRPADAALQ